MFFIYLTNFNSSEPINIREVVINRGASLSGYTGKRNQARDGAAWEWHNCPDRPACSDQGSRECVYVTENLLKTVQNFCSEEWTAQELRAIANYKKRMGNNDFIPASSSVQRQLYLRRKMTNVSREEINFFSWSKKKLIITITPFPGKCKYTLCYPCSNGIDSYPTADDPYFVLLTICFNVHKGIDITYLTTAYW